ncbi:hypothetical protein PYW07_009842 [Mythimna separata]|uniref:Cytochrome P450 n=1 Tax=Mythimna separata TaxID=271217 RepID=A0AAD7YGE1_MYTSE|nr:hypothetical protein PYW07_009842 [Mythimna separata]
MVEISRAFHYPRLCPDNCRLLDMRMSYLNTSQELLKFLADDCAKQGGVTYFLFGRELSYLIVDPQDALTAANACLIKHYGYDLGKSWMGDGLLISSGDIWKRHRKLLNPAFTLPVIYGFLDVFNNQAKKLASAMEPQVGKGFFDHFPYMKHNALETLCVGTFGINAIDDDNFLQKYMNSVNEMVNIGITRVVKFWLQNDFIYGLSKLKKKEIEVLKNLHAMTNTVLQKKKAAIKNEVLTNKTEFKTTDTKYKPFLDLLLELSKNGDLTDREVREELDTIIAAGYETTSNQLTYTLLLLGAHPEVQEKLCKELFEVLGSERDVEKEDVNKLVYTNAVLMESLRMFPSVPITLKYVDKDVKLSRTYAMITMKVVLAHFLRRYQIQGDISKLKMQYEFVMRPISGHEIRIKRRM